MAETTRGRYVTSIPHLPREPSCAQQTKSVTQGSAEQLRGLSQHRYCYDDHRDSRSYDNKYCDTYYNEHRHSYQSDCMSNDYRFKHHNEQYCGGCERYMDRCNCHKKVSHSHENDEYGKNIYYKPVQRKDPWPPLRESGPVTSEDREFRKIEAVSVDTLEFTANPEEIFVPSPQYLTLGDALKKIQVARKPLGYTITLKSGTHTLAKSINNDLSFLRIRAESWTPHMGLFYGQDLGQGGEFGRLFNDELETDITGIGPWRLEVKDKRVTVYGINFQNPNFESLRTGDIIRFYHRDEDCFTDHCVCSGCENHIFLDDKICLNTDDGEPLSGEGFVVMPRTRIEIAGPQKLIIQGRLEWRGVHIKQPKETPKNHDPCHNKRFSSKGHFTAGATAGFHEIAHTVVSSNLYNVGSFEMYRPNTYANGLFVNTSGSGGRGLYQSVIGSKASASFHAGIYSVFDACNVVGSKRGLDLVNGSDVTATFGTFIGNKIAVRAESTSRFGCGGCMFMENVTGIFAISGSHYHSREIAGFANEMFAISFLNNTTAMQLDINAHGLADIIVVDANTTDLLLDGDPKQLPTANNIEIGARLSTYIYGSVNP